MKRLQLMEIEMETRFWADMFEIEKCGNIQGIVINHIYIDGEHNHVEAILPNGLRYKYFGSFTCDLVGRLNAFIKGFNSAVEVLE